MRPITYLDLLSVIKVVVVIIVVNRLRYDDGGMYTYADDSGKTAEINLVVTGNPSK